MLDFYSAWPIPVCLLLLALAAATPLFKAADAPPSIGVRRIATLDGLRGFLASCVVIHHVAVYHEYLKSGLWLEPQQLFLGKLGAFSVGLFFIITGYLFWNRLLRSEGRPAWFDLYLSRVFRIGPVYLLTAIIVILTVMAETGFAIRVPGLELLKQIAGWLGLGVTQGLAINGVEHTRILVAGVTWTLQYEWYFYFSLPLIAPLARSKSKHLWFVVGALVVFLAGIHLVPQSYRGYVDKVDLFLIGSLIASLKQDRKLLRLSPNLGSCLLLLATLAAFITMSYSLFHLLLGVIMYLVLSGASLFGVLESRAAIRLGDISYGIYLLQGLVMAFAFSIERVRSFALDSPLGHWTVGVFCLLATAMFALVVHRLVEEPGIALGKRLAVKLHAQV